MNSLRVTMNSWWHWTSVVVLFVTSLLVPAMALPAGNSMSERCQWACARGRVNSNNEAVTLGCDCAKKKLVKRFAAVDPEVARNKAQLALLLETLLGTKDYAPLLEEGSQGGYGYSSAGDNRLMKMPPVQKRAYMEPRIPGEDVGVDADLDAERAAAIKMVRSKKRWLSLHDEYGARDGDDKLVVNDLWKDDSSRKAFRYG